MNELNYIKIQKCNASEVPYTELTSNGLMLFLDKSDGILKCVDKLGAISKLGIFASGVAGFTCNSITELEAITTATAGTPESVSVEFDRWGVDGAITMSLKSTESALIDIPTVVIAAGDNYGTLVINFDETMEAGDYSFVLLVATSTHEWEYEFTVTVTPLGD